KRGKGERGATMVLAAILNPVLAAFAGLAWGTAMVYGANQEGRRAADMAALATASAMPMFNLATSCQVTSSNYVPLPGTPNLPGIPATTVPTTAPPPTTPQTTVPQTTVPQTTVPQTSVPPTSVPETPLTPTPPAIDPGNNPMN